MEELLQKLALDNFFVKSSKGNYLAVRKDGDKWYAQGKEVRRQSDIDYIEQQYEKNKKDVEKTYKQIMDDLEYGLWDSGNLSISEQAILDALMEQGIVTRTPGVPGEHDTANGVAKWIYTLAINESDEEERSHRLNNREKSDAAKLAWKRHHSSYMHGTRKRERNMENRTFYGIAKELDEAVNEATIQTDNVFDKQEVLSFDTISGGISFGIKNGIVSFSASLKESGSGSYKLENGNPEALYKELADELLQVCQMVDTEMKQILAKHGLKSTK